MSHLLKSLATVACLVSGIVAGDLSTQDRKFLEDAYKDGMREIEMGRLGVTRGTSPQLKVYAQKLIDDHSQSTKDVQEMAKQKNVMLPIDEPTMHTRLTEDPGPALDAHFIKVAIEDHEKDVKEFEKEIRSGNDPDVRNWASMTLPALRAHLDAAKALSH